MYRLHGRNNSHRQQRRNSKICTENINRNTARGVARCLLDKTRSTYKRMGAVHENKIRGKRRKKSYYVCFGAWVRRILYKRKKNRRLLYRPTYVELRKDGVLQEVRRYGTYQGRRQRAGSAFGRGILLSKPRMGT